MALLGAEKILVLYFLVSCCQCDSFNLTETLNYVLALLDIKPKDISTSCYNQLNELRDNLEKPESELWALQMVDATSKVQSGIMSLNIGELGNFEQCINTKGTLSNGKKVTGKYCLGHLSLDTLKVQERFKGLNNRIHEQMLIHSKSSAINNMAGIANSTLVMGPTWAGCFPDGCTTSDVNKIANQFLQTFVDTTATITFDDEYCQTEKHLNPQITAGPVAIIVILSCYGCLLLLCTIGDFIFQRRDMRRSQLMTAFAMCNNIKQLFQLTNDPNHKHCLDGLKVLSMIWVVLAHQYSITFSGPISNAMELIKWADSRYSMFIISSTLSVDTFLVISAFLLTTRFLRERSENSSPPLYRYYVQRYVRLAPALFFMVLISSTISMRFGTGPRWPSVNKYFQENCAYYWWSTFLFVQNYMNVQNMCLPHSWYLSIDMQLFPFSLILLYCLHKWNKTTGFVVAICVFLSIELSFHAAWANQLTAILSNPHGDVESYYSNYYLLTHTRAAPWLMGILCGNLVHLYYKGNFSGITWWCIKTCAPLCWATCLAILIGCIVVGHQALRQPTYDPWKNALHIALVRPFWALAICWIIIACLTDTGKTSETIDDILSFSWFQIMSRFVYSLYLVHVTTMYLISLTRSTPVHFSEFDMIYLFWGNLVLSLIGAFIWVVAFETPFINLEKLTRRIVAQEGSVDEQSPRVSESRSLQEEFALEPLHFDEEEQAPLNEDETEE